MAGAGGAVNFRTTTDVVVTVPDDSVEGFAVAAVGVCAEAEAAAAGFAEAPEGAAAAAAALPPAACRRAISRKDSNV